MLYLFILAAAVFVSVLFMLFCGRIFLPLRADGCRAEIVLHIECSCKSPEAALRGAERLAKYGGVAAVVVDCGASPEVRSIIEAFCNDRNFEILSPATSISAEKAEVERT